MQRSQLGFDTKWHNSGLPTIPNIHTVLKTLDKFITEKIIPDTVSSNDRKFLSLPVQVGGMCIPIFTQKFATENMVTLESNYNSCETLVQENPNKCNKKM